MLKNKQNYLIVFIILIFFFLQIYFINDESSVNDEMVYAWNVVKIVENPVNIFSPIVWQFHSPLFSILATFFSFFLTPLISVRLLSVLFAVGAIWITYLIGKDIRNSYVGVLASSILAFYSYFFFASHFGLLDSGLTFGVLVTVYGLFCYAKNNSVKLIIFGVLFSIFLKRSGFLAYATMLAGMLFLEWNQYSAGRKFGFGKIIKWVFLLLLGIVLWVFSEQFDRPILYFYDYSAGLFSILSVNVAIFSKLISPILGFFLLIGSFFILKDRNWKELFLFGWVASFFPILFFPLADVRYFLPIYPSLALIAAIGFEKMMNFNNLLNKIVGTLSLFLLFLLLLHGPIAAGINMMHNPVSVGYSDVGDWLKENAQNAWIFDGKEREIRYYSGIELEQWGGYIIKYPETSEEFESKLIKLEKPIYALVSDWPNIFGPFYPTDDYLIELGFKKVYGSKRTIDREEKMVLRIYKLED